MRTKIKITRELKREVMSRAWRIFRKRRIIMGRELPSIYTSFGDALKYSWEVLKRDIAPAESCQVFKHACDEPCGFSSTIDNITYLVREVAYNSNYNLKNK